LEQEGLGFNGAFTASWVTFCKKQIGNIGVAEKLGMIL